MKPVPLTRARHADNFVVALHDKGIPTQRLLDLARIPAGVLRERGGDGIISALSMLEFAEISAHNTGIRDLGYWAGQVPLEGYGEFGKRVVGALTLYDAISTFCREVRGECSEADYFLRHDAPSAWFCHGAMANPTGGQSQHELYALMIIVQVIRLALGPDWFPIRVSLQSTDESCASSNKYLRRTNVEFGAQITAVEFPLKSLAKPLQRLATSTGTSNPAINVDLPSDPLVALKELLSLYIRHSANPTIETLAEHAGVSSRTLQRFLNSRSTRFVDLLDEARFKLALPSLEDPSVAITDIAFDLGYANLAHFSRAFKRMTGMSPRIYRHLLNE
jgi:AraC-like DNA-binding protein